MGYEDRGAWYWEGVPKSSHSMTAPALTPEQRRDAELGMRWWNGLSEAERRRWLDLAWRRNQRAAGRISYALEDMPSVADAWAEFKRSTPLWDSSWVATLRG